MKNIRKYGYPFGPNEWIFHISIGSVPRNKYEEIWRKAQKFNLTKTWKVNGVGAYVDFGEDGFRLFRKYKF